MLYTYIRMTMHTGNQGPFEHEILAVYKRNSGVAFHEGAFNYAKTLCCLRWISVIKVKCMHTYVRTCTQLYVIRIYVQVFSVC